MNLSFPFSLLPILIIAFLLYNVNTFTLIYIFIFNIIVGVLLY
nr:MAG TPA: hypothetical protein [Bacteriophage sp.]